MQARRYGPAKGQFPQAPRLYPCKRAYTRVLNDGGGGIDLSRSAERLKPVRLFSVGPPSTWWCSRSMRQVIEEFDPVLEAARTAGSLPEPGLSEELRDQGLSCSRTSRSTNASAGI
jgi:hypothetical protein